MKCSRARCGNVQKRRGLCSTHYSALPSGYVDAEPARERYDLLRSTGLTVDQIAQLSGVHRDTLRLMGSWTPGGRVRRQTFDRVMSVPVPGGFQATRSKIPALGTHRRIQALAAAGHSLGFQANELGITQQAVSAILRKDMVWAETAQKVAELFDRLQLVVGSSSRARGHAKRKGWAVPLAYDNIDDPGEQPNLGEATVLLFPEKYVEVTDYLGIKGEERIADALGISLEALDRQLFRYGMKGTAA